MHLGASAGVSYPLKPKDVLREGVRVLSMDQVLTFTVEFQLSRPKLGSASAIPPQPTLRAALLCED